MSTQFNNVDLKLLKLAPPRANKNASGFKSSYIQYKGQKLGVQTPVMKLPWDVKPRQMDDNSNVSANLSLSFTGMSAGDEDCELNRFLEFMKAFDDRIKELATDMDGALGKKSEMKVIDGNFRDSVKEAGSGDYPPTIQPKIWVRCRDGGSSKCVEDHTMDLAVYDMERNMVDADNLVKGCIAAAIIEPNTVWCSSMGVGVTWVAKQVIVKPVATESFAFSLGDEHNVLRSEPAAKKSRTQEYSDEEERSHVSADSRGEADFEEEF